MTAPLLIPCPRCQGQTVSKGKDQRRCVACQYRFRYPLVVCKICGAPKSSGQGRRLPFCDKHYPDEGTRHRVDYKRGRVTVGPAAHFSPKPAPKPAPVFAHASPGEAITCPDGTRLVFHGNEVTINDGNPLPASPVEVSMWGMIQELLKR